MSSADNFTQWAIKARLMAMLMIKEEGAKWLDQKVRREYSRAVTDCCLQINPTNSSDFLV